MQNQLNITRFGLIRHAETVWNREKRIQGQSDSSLTDEGRQDAAKWARKLQTIRWDCVFSSDTGRARQTAEIINSFLKRPHSVDPRLREQDWGQWTALTIAQIQAENPRELESQVNAGWNFRPPGGESRLDIWNRSRQALLEAAANRTGQTTLVVAHEGVLKALIYRLDGRRFLSSEPPLIKTPYLHWLAVEEKDLRIEKVNAIRLA